MLPHYKEKIMFVCSVDFASEKIKTKSEEQLNSSTFWIVNFSSV